MKKKGKTPSHSKQNRPALSHDWAASLLLGRIPALSHCPIYRPRGSASWFVSFPVLRSTWRRRRSSAPTPAAAGSAGVPSRAALRRGPGPDHSPPQQLRPHGGNQSIPPPPILFLWGLDWLGNAMSGDLDLTPRDRWFGTGNRKPACATCSSVELVGRVDHVGFL